MSTKIKRKQKNGIKKQHQTGNAMPQAQLIQPDPRQFVEAVLEDGGIGDILNVDLDPSAPDEQL